MTRSQQLWLLTGQRGRGKTQCLQHLIGLIKERAPTIGIQGLLSPGVFEEGNKIAIDLANIASDTRKRLANQIDGDASGDSLRTKHWSFDQATIEWGNDQLRAMPPTGLFIMDELGPLEFERGRGLMAAVERVDQSIDNLRLLVVRPELLPAARQRWRVDQTFNVDNRPSAHEAAQELFNATISLFELETNMPTDEGGSKSQLIAFASDDGETISTHFSRARQYLVLRLEQGQVTERQLREKFSPHARGETHGSSQPDHDQVHQKMVEPIKDCQLVVAGGMGHGARHHLELAGIEILLTGEAHIDQAVDLYLADNLDHEPSRLHHGPGHHN